jgi:hypothetical protein
MNENEKKEKLAKLLMSYITANILAESLDEDLINKNLFQRQTKFYAKGLLESLEKDIVPLYKSMQTSESVAGYTEIFDLIKNFIKDLTNEITENIEV